MALPELLSRIDELQARIIAAGPLSPEAKRKLDYRIRLDWNYHSNVMEGSLLTKQETRTIMLGNVTVEGKPIKDVLEMQGHDEVVLSLLHMASGEMNLSESRIKTVHKAIVREDAPEKKDWPGNWKKHPNHIHNFKGERFDFTAPEDVPEAMHRLLDKTKAAIERIERKEQDAPHPTVLAFDFHREYVTIHPFHDGNGRTARIFSNLLLMRFGYPPVIIHAAEKETYSRYLAEVQVYEASPDLFNEFMAERLIRSQQLVVDVLEGRSLEEDDDLDKRLKLIEAQVAGIDPAEEIKRTRGPEATRAMMNEWGFALLEKAIHIGQKVQHFFLNKNHYIGIVSSGVNVPFKEEPPEVVIAKVREQLRAEADDRLHGINEVHLAFGYGSFRKASRVPFGCNYGLSIKFDDWHHYQVLVDVFHTTAGRQQEELFKRLLHKPLTPLEVDSVVRRFGKEIADHIEHHLAIDLAAGQDNNASA